MRPLAGALVAAAALAMAACGGGGGGEAAGTETGGGAAAGKAVFDAQGCGSCHTLQAAGATGTIGPNLDEQLVSSAQKASEPLADFTKESIVDPNAFVAEGFSPNVMPGGFGQKLSGDELNALVDFIVQSVQG